MNASTLQALLDGLLMGGVYALAALGVSLIFGVMKITNFAHGALITLGMYVTYQIYSMFHINPYIALPAVIIIMFLIGFIIQRLLINSIIKAPSHNQLLLTLGLSIVIQNLIMVIWSPNPKSISVASFEKAFRIDSITFNKPKLIAFIFVIVITLGIYFILYKTDLGKAIRGTSMERDGAILMGIRVEKINAIAFGIGTACAGVAGALISTSVTINTTIGGNFQLKCFVIAVFGGLGNIWGAVIAGLIIGVVESLSSFYFGGSWSEMVIYLIFILVLFLKPTGLLGKKG